MAGHDEPMTPSESAGREFSVGAVLHNVVGGGHLYIAPGVLELRTGPVSRGVSGIPTVRHDSSEVVLYRARLMPPWMSCSVVVSDDQRTVLATFAGWMRRSILGALRGAGFDVTEKVTKLDRGYQLLTVE